MIARMAGVESDAYSRSSDSHSISRALSAGTCDSETPCVVWASAPCQGGWAKSDVLDKPSKRAGDQSLGLLLSCLRVDEPLAD